MSDRCPTCGGRYVTWTPAKILAACQGWSEQNGRAPVANDWEQSGPHHPSTTGVIRHFGAWNTMVEAAGFTPRARGGQAAWSRDAASDALFRWVFDHGRQPQGREWRRPAAGRPTAQQCSALFGSWNAFLVASGYKPARSYRSLEGYARQAGAVTRNAVTA